MATLYISEAEAVRDIADLIQRVRSGDAFVISDGNDAGVTIAATEVWTAPGEDTDYDAWVRAEVQKSVDNPAPAVDRDTAQAIFLEHRKSLLAKSGQLPQ